MEKTSLRLLFPHTDFYQSLICSKYQKVITYQKERILIYLYDENNRLLSIFIIHFKFNLLNTKCNVEIYKDGKLKDQETIYLSKNKFNQINIKQKVKKR